MSIWNKVTGPGVATDNTDQVKQEAPGTPIDDLVGSRSNKPQRPAPVSNTRPPDEWVIDQSGARIPMWTPEESVKPKWKSKIFITQLVMFLFSVATAIFGVNISLEMQHMVLNMVLAITGGGSFITIIFRFFFTKKKLI